MKSIDDLGHEKRQRLEEERRAAEKAKRKEMFGRLSLLCGSQGNVKPSEEQLMHFFDEAGLVGQEELEIRRIARAHDIAIPDAEAIKAHFDRYDEDCSGEIDKNEFRHMLQDMLDVAELPEARINEFWLFVDHDVSGSVNFEEFMCWFYPTFGAPRKRALDAKMQSQRKQENSMAVASSLGNLRLRHRASDLAKEAMGSDGTLINKSLLVH